MSGLLSLSPELICSVLASLDDVRDLPAAILTCRYIHTSFMAWPSIAADTLSNQISPELLPYAAAAMLATDMSHPRTDAQVTEFLDTFYATPEKIVARLRPRPLSVIMLVGQTHVAIHELASQFATEAWELLGVADSKFDEPLVLSSTEVDRFLRSFYRLELFISLFQTDKGQPKCLGSQIGYLLKLSPWEGEQLCCVEDFLADKLFRVSVQALQQWDGEKDSYPNVAPSRYGRFVSRGLKFYHEVLKDPSEPFQRVEKSPMKYSGRIALWRSFRIGRRAHRFQYMELEIDPGETMLPLQRILATSHDKEDLEYGPHLAWRAGHLSPPPIAPAGLLIGVDENGGLREFAYVLWDLERMERFDMINFIVKMTAAETRSIGRRGKGRAWLYSFLIRQATIGPGVASGPGGSTLHLVERRFIYR